MIKNERVRERIEDVRQWLEENVRVYPTPTSITVCNIELDPELFSGTATLLIGDEQPGEDLLLHLGATGCLTYSPPMIHSPLDVPASYLAFELTKNTQRAVSTAVQNLRPRLLPLGLHPVTKEWITISTPLHQRVLDLSELDAALKRLAQPDFKVIQAVDQD
jgi:hypothetical protein